MALNVERIGAAATARSGPAEGLLILRLVGNIQGASVQADQSIFSILGSPEVWHERLVHQHRSCERPQADHVFELRDAVSLNFDSSSRICSNSLRRRTASRYCCSSLPCFALSHIHSDRNPFFRFFRLAAPSLSSQFPYSSEPIRKNTEVAIVEQQNISPFPQLRGST